MVRKNQNIGEETENDASSITRRKVSRELLMDVYHTYTGNEAHFKRNSLRHNYGSNELGITDQYSFRESEIIFSSGEQSSAATITIESPRGINPKAILSEFLKLIRSKQ